MLILIARSRGPALVVEEWRQLAPPYEAYAVSNLGQVRNAAGHVLLGSHVGEYHRVALSASNGTGTKSFLVHRLVASTFIRLAMAGEVADHKNHDPRDNRAVNLRWLSRQENNRHRIRAGGKIGRPVLQFTLDGKFVARYARIVNAPFGATNIGSACAGRLPHAYGFVWRYEEEPTQQNEVWKTVKVSQFKISVSSLGRVRLRSGKSSRGWSSHTGYRVVTFSWCGKVTTFVIHRLVALAHLPRPDHPTDQMEVDHIDGDRGNNTATNLAWVLPSENVRRFSQKRGRVELVRRAVVATPITGGESQTYESVQAAARATKSSAGNIVMACQGQRKVAVGCHWAYVE